MRSGRPIPRAADALRLGPPHRPGGGGKRRLHVRGPFRSCRRHVHNRLHWQQPDADFRGKARHAARIHAMKRLLLFAGTTEGRRLAEELSKDWEVTASVATAYGAQLLPSQVRVLTGRLDEPQIEALLRQENFDVLGRCHASLCEGGHAESANGRRERCGAVPAPRPAAEPSARGCPCIGNRRKSRRCPG